MTALVRHVGLLLGLAALAGAAGAQAEPVPEAPAAPAPAAVPVWDAEETAAIQCLRALRKKERPSDEELARRLSRAGERLVPLYFDFLAARRVPGLAPEQEPQVLSEVQEHALLLALATFERGAVLSHVTSALQLERSPPRRHAALGFTGAVGRANDLPALLELALGSQETHADERLLAALERAVTRVCRRDPRAFEQLVRLRRVTRPELLPTLVRAVGATRDPMALAFLAEIAYWHEGLVLEVMSQVAALGPSGDEGVDQALRVRLRSYLDERQVAHCRAAITGLAALGDVEAIGSLIPLLASTHAGLAQNAHWALGRLTGLSMPADAKAWERWHQAERVWLLRNKPTELQRLRNHDPAYVAAALRALLAHPLAHRELAAALPDLLKNKTPGLRILACRSLAEIGAREATEKLVWALEDPQPDVVQAAHAALCTLTGLDLPAEPEAWQAATRSAPRATQL